MKTLAPVKNDYMLEAPLEILHEESLEWLQEIEFWKDEVAFFYKLMITKGKRKPPTKSLLSIQNQIIYFSSEKLDDLKLEIQTHERYLSKMIKSVRQDDEAYRLKHKIISNKVGDFEKMMKQMKKNSHEQNIYEYFTHNSSTSFHNMHGTATQRATQYSRTIINCAASRFKIIFF